MGGGGGSKQEPTAEEKALARRGANEFNDYVDRFLPVEDKFYELSRATDASREQQRGAANAEAAMAHAESRQGLGDAMARSGSAPSSGRAVLGTSDLSDAQAEGSAMAQGEADRAVQDREQNARVKMSAFGRELSDQSSMSLRDSGRRAQDAAGRAQERAIQDRQALISSASSVAGLGVAKATSGPYSGVKGVQRGSEQDHMLAAQTSGLKKSGWRF